MATSQDFVNWVCGPKVSSAYLRYVFMLEQDSIRRFAHGTTHQTMYYPEAKALCALLPSRRTQDAITEVLGSLDDKIAANAARIALFQDLAAAYLAQAIADGRRSATVGDIAKFHNRRRVPLSSREREVRTGTVPYYGAAGRAGLIDKSIFDEVLVLVGEDGSVITQDERPVVQYIWGPAWVNNHAHVLTGENVSTEMLRLVLWRHRVAHLVTGAVQPKLSMGNLKKLEIDLPANPAVVDALVQPLAAAERALSNESARLAATRDELLPLLMSGKVRVRQAEQVVTARH
jgi:type I restriction enzyme S subunit